MICGLLGEKLGHSYSPQIHNLLADYEYRLFEKSDSELGKFLKNGIFHGLNVTIPYKKAVIPFCKELSPQAKTLGAVNTIVRKADGSLIGHNTDYFGFQWMTQRMNINFNGKKVLVLGSGGASNTVCAVLKELGAKVVVISRNGVNNYDNLNLHTDCAVIVNATPVGMYPNTGISPIDLSLFPALEGVMDLIYNPARTQLLLDAEKRGIKTENGLAMLVAQAKESAEWFSGKTITNHVISQIHKQLQKEMENIILIGMPGCGKSTVGKLLAEKLGKQFYDADEEIEKSAGCTIPEIFHEKGAEGFREIETSVLTEIGKCSGAVIATGGGCVTKERNYTLLHQNGTIIWIQRAITALPTEGRPLSQTNKLHEMYAIRKPMYEAFADRTVINADTPEGTVAEIVQFLEVTK